MIFIKLIKISQNIGFCSILLFNLFYFSTQSSNEYSELRNNENIVENYVMNKYKKENTNLKLKGGGLYNKHPFCVLNTIAGSIIALSIGMFTTGCIFFFGHKKTNIINKTTETYYSYTCDNSSFSKCNNDTIISEFYNDLKSSNIDFCMGNSYHNLTNKKNPYFYEVILNENNNCKIELSNFYPENKIAYNHSDIESSIKSIFNNKKTTSINITKSPKFKLYNTYFINLFSNLNNLKYIDISNLDFSFTKSTNLMFYNSTIDNIIGLNNRNFNSLISSDEMFSCLKTNILNLSNSTFNILTESNNIFSGSEINTIDLSNVELKKLLESDEDFSNSKIENLILDNTNITNINTLSKTFKNTNISYISLNNLDIKKVKNINGMFENINKTNLNISNLNLNHIVSINDIFKNSNIENL